MARQENSPRIGSCQARLGRTACGIAVRIVRRPGWAGDGSAFGHPGPDLVQLRRRCHRSRRSHLENHRADFGRGGVALARRGPEIPHCAAGAACQPVERRRSRSVPCSERPFSSSRKRTNEAGLSRERGRGRHRPRRPAHRRRSRALGRRHADHSGPPRARRA